LKAFVAFLAVIILGYSSRIALITGIALAQIGEFSFVLAGVGRANGLLAGISFPVFLASSILTILATPFLIRIAPGLALRSERAFRWDGRIKETRENPAAKLKEHVIIAGYGLNGRNLAHVLKESGIPYVILELNPESVRIALSRGEPVIFGDVSSRTILKEAGVERARGMVFAISDPPTTRRGVRLARELSPGLFIIVRTRFASEIDELYGLGANEVIPEEFETSIEIFTRVLDRYHIPRNIIDAQVKVLRGECYGILRGTCELDRPSAQRIADLLTAGTAETFYILDGTWPAGKALREINLRRKTGATVIAVVRGETSFASPGADFLIESGDTLVLVASHQDMDRAFQFLTLGEPDEKL
jgi:CPA2 family monovalent cation:H+ antiporter-2